MTSIITFEQMKRFYTEFKQNLPSDNFMRWYQEYNFANNLKAYAKKQNLTKDVFEYEQIAKKAAQELKKMGYKV